MRKTRCFLAGVLGVAITLGCLHWMPLAVAQEKENPLLTTVKAAVTDPSKPFTMIVSIEVKEGQGKKFEAAFAKCIRETRKEKGCIAYDLNRDLKKPAHYQVYERWQNISSLAAHMNAQHLKALLAETGDMLAGPPTVVVMAPSGEK